MAGTTIDIRAGPDVPAAIAATSAAPPNAETDAVRHGAGVEAVDQDGEADEERADHRQVDHGDGRRTVRICASAIAYRSPAVMAPAVVVLVSGSRQRAPDEEQRDGRKTKVIASIPKPRAEPVAAMATPAMAGPTCPSPPCSP